MIDTNILLDWLLDRDVIRSKKIDRLIEESEQLQVPDTVIVELAFALEKHYRLPRKVVATNIAKVLDEPVFSCNRTLFSRTLIDYLDHPLSFLDSCLIHSAELEGDLPLWTFDRKLVTQSGGRAKLLA